MSDNQDTEVSSGPTPLTPTVKKYSNSKNQKTYDFFLTDCETFLRREMRYFETFCFAIVAAVGRESCKVCQSEGEREVKS